MNWYFKQKSKFFRKKMVNDNQNSFKFVIEDFFKETIIILSKENSIYFDKKLNRGGVLQTFSVLLFALS